MTSLYMLTLFLLMTSKTLQHCLHDSILPQHEDDNDVIQNDDDVFRKRRDVEETENKSEDVLKLGEFYKKIRLKLQFDFENTDLSYEERKRLEEQATKAAEKLSSILRVIPEEKPLIFNRENVCKSIWIYPRQAFSQSQKCAELNPSYNGEMCMNEFKIPDEYLEGFEIFDQASSEESRNVFQNGSGITDAG